MNPPTQPLDRLTLLTISIAFLVGVSGAVGGAYTYSYFTDDQQSTLSVQAGTGPGVLLTLERNDGGNGNVVYTIRWATDGDNLTSGRLTVGRGDGTLVTSFDLAENELDSGKRTVALHENGTYQFTVWIETEGLDGAATREVEVTIPPKKNDGTTQRNSSSAGNGSRSGSNASTSAGSQNSTTTANASGNTTDTNANTSATSSSNATVETSSGVSNNSTTTNSTVNSTGESNTTSNATTERTVPTGTLIDTFAVEAAGRTNPGAEMNPVSSIRAWRATAVRAR